MASGDARPFPKKGVAYRVTFPIFDNDGDLVSGAAGLDSEISKDGGTFVDVTAEATQIATASGMYFLDLTATEMNADTVAIIVKTTTPDAKTTPIVLYPEEAGDIRVDVTEWKGVAPNALVSGRVDSRPGAMATGVITASAIAANAIGAGELAADAVNEIADQVWNEAKSGHVVAGSFGEEVQAHALSSEIPGAAPTAAANADAVWDELKAGHVGVGSFGEEVQAHALSSEIPGAAPTAAANADAVWDELKAGHVGVGSFGEEVQAHALTTDIPAMRGTDSAALALVCTEARLAELDAVNVPADLDTLIARLTTARAANLDEITAVRLAELDAVNVPADLDTLIARLTTARAANLDEITAVRLAELGATNLPADMDTLLVRLTADRATLLDKLTHVEQPIRVGTAQAGSFTTITLDASASASNNFYSGKLIQLTGGINPNQSRFITGYDGITKVATVAPAWGAIPDVTTTFTIWSMDELLVHSRDELTAIPAANAFPLDKLELLAMALRNASTSTVTERKVMNDSGTAIGTATMSEDGTTFDQGKLV